MSVLAPSPSPPLIAIAFEEDPFLPGRLASPIALRRTLSCQAGCVSPSRRQCIPSCLCECARMSTCHAHVGLRIRDKRPVRWVLDGNTATRDITRYNLLDTCQAGPNLCSWHAIGSSPAKIWWILAKQDRTFACTAEVRAIFRCIVRIFG